MTNNYLHASLELLGDVVHRPDLIELCFNPDGRVWGEFQGDVHMQALEFERIKPTYANDIGNQIAAAAGAAIGAKKPILSVSVDYNGRPIRAQVVRSPVVQSGTALSLRFFPSINIEDVTLDFLHGSEHSLQEERLRQGRALRKIVKTGSLEEALEFCVSAKLNMIVSGGTSTGKTFAARKILSFIPDEERLITIEDAQELQPTQPNHVGLIANAEDPMRTTDILLASTLRMRPDRIILGEVRGKEAMTFLEAINTGHGGSLTTLHAETPQLALQRLTIAALKSDNTMTYADMQRYIAASIDVVIQLGRDKGKRGITEFYLPKETH